jgi:hypothetical protein
MSVSDNNVTAALTYLAADPHPIAEARFRLAMAENNSKQVYARAFLKTDGTVKERECTAETDREVIESKSNEADCVLEFERHRSRVKAAEMLLEVWRTENANARAAERIR